MQINPYLSYNGNCKAAFQFYADCLGENITADDHLGKSLVMAGGLDGMQQ